MGNFTGGPVVKPLHFCLREHGWEAKIPCATRPKKKKRIIVVPAIKQTELIFS